jgi:hypothetical protein
MGDQWGNAVNGHFPVEISEDGNTIIVKPLVYSGISYYPNAALYYGGGQYSMSLKVISEITLTRNTSSAAPAKVASKRNRGTVEKERLESQQEIKTPARPASRAAFTPAKEYKMVEGQQYMSSKQRAEEWFNIRRKAGRN